MTKNQESYSQCKSISTLFQETITTNMVNGNFDNLNIVDNLNLFILHSDSFLNEIKQGNYGSNNSAFIFENSVEKTSHILGDILSESAGCLNNLSGLLDNVVYYTIVAIIIVAASFVLISVSAIKSLKNSVKEMWNKKIVYSKRVSGELMKYLNDQLQMTGSGDELNMEYEDCKEGKEKFYRNYVFYVFGFVVISGVIIFSCFYEVRDISKMILNAPIIKLNLATRKYIYHQMMFYTSQGYILNNNLTGFPNDHKYSTIQYGDYNILEDLTKKQKALLRVAQSKDIKIYNSEHNNKIQLYSYSGSNPRFKIGSMAGSRSVIHDMLLIYDTNNQNYTNLSLQNSQISCMSSFLFSIYINVDEMSQILINLIGDFKPYFFSILTSKFNTLVLICSLLLSLLILSLLLNIYILNKESANYSSVHLIISIMINNKN